MTSFRELGAWIRQHSEPCNTSLNGAVAVWELSSVARQEGYRNHVAAFPIRSFVANHGPFPTCVVAFMNAASTKLRNDWPSRWVDSIRHIDARHSVD